MADTNRSESTTVLVNWLAGAFALVGLAPLAAASIPTETLIRAAQQLDHADDVTAERIFRLRFVGIALATAHLLLAAALVTSGRDRAHQFLAELWRELVSIRPVEAGLRAWRQTTRFGWLHVAALMVVITTAAAVRYRYLQIPMDYDEAYSFLNYARRPLYEGLVDYNSTNNHLLNTLFMHLSFRAIGTQEWALRLHVLVAGLGLVASIYVLGRTMFGADAGLVAAALAATSHTLVNYSVNARGYMWVAWMTLMLLAAIWRITAPGALSIDWLISWLAAVIGLFAMPTMLYAVAAGFVWLLIYFVRSGITAREMGLRLGTWLGVVALSTFWLYAPALVYRGLTAWQDAFVSARPWGQWMVHAPAAWWLSLRSAIEGPVPWGVWLVVLLAGVCILWLRQRHICWFLLCPFGLTFLLMTVQRVAPPPRVFSFLSPLYLLIVAAGLGALCQLVCDFNWSGTRRDDANGSAIACRVVVCGICAWGSVVSWHEPLPGGLRPSFLVEDVAELWQQRRPAPAAPPNQLWRLDVEPAVAAVEAELRPGDRVLVGLPADLPFHFYAARRGWSTPIGGDPQHGERLFLIVRSDELPRNALRENLALRVDEPWVLEVGWQLVARGHLAIWRASSGPAGTTE